MLRTSISHPLQTVAVSTLPRHGRIGVTFCPGKVQASAATGAWARDLDLDVQTIADWGAAAVLTLIEPHEITALQVEGLGRAVERAHMDWLHAPIPDVSTPDAAFEAAWVEVGEGLRDRLRELEFEFPLAGGALRRDAPRITLADVGRLLRVHLPAGDPLAPYAERLSSGALAAQPLKGYLNGSLDAVLRVGEHYLVVDYKTNWLGDPAGALTAADYAPDRLTEAMLHSDYVLQALLYVVVLHRYLRWRVLDYQPDRHLGGVLYLFVRGMCGPPTPVVDGQPAGVFSWRPPAELVTAVSDLLDGAGVTP